MAKTEKKIQTNATPVRHRKKNMERIKKAAASMSEKMKEVGDNASGAFKSLSPTLLVFVFCFVCNEVNVST